MQEKEFKTEFTVDVNILKEFTNGYSARKNIVIKILSILYLILLIINIIEKDYNILIGLISIILFSLLIVKIARLSKIQYKRMISTNKNLPIRNRFTINKDGIKGVNLDTNNKNEYAFDQINCIVETQNLFILKMKYNLGIMIDKNNLTGGTKEEFIQFMFDNCANIKKKKIYKSKYDIWTNRSYIIALVIILVTAIVMSGMGDKNMQNLKRHLEANEYKLYDDTYLYENSEVISATRVTKDDKIQKTIIFQFKNEKTAKIHFEFWADEDINEKSIKEKEFYVCDDGLILVLNGEYVVYGDEDEEQKEELTDLLETINNYL